MNDNELLYLINEGNEEAYNLIFQKYRNTIETISKKYLIYGKKLGLDYNDLIQEGMIGLSEAIANYKETKDAKFVTFANYCIRNQIFSILASNSRKKHNILNESASLDYAFDGGDSLFNLLKDNSIDPESVILDKENTDNLYNKLTSQLSDFEKKVFDLKMSGLDYKEIAIILDKSYKSISTAMNRIQKKLNKFDKNIDYNN